MSITATTLLVRWLPNTSSHIHSPANNSNMQATDAGKDTAKCLKKVSTPKHATRMTSMPLGTKIQDRRRVSREFHIACSCVSSATGILCGRWGCGFREDQTNLLAIRTSLITSNRPAADIKTLVKETAMIYNGKLSGPCTTCGQFSWWTYPAQSNNI